MFAGYDPQQECGKIFFYDILGAEFKGVEHAVSGSGSPTIRGIVDYLNHWGEQPLSTFSEEQAIPVILRLLASAAEFDSATGGVNHEANLYPIMKRITGNGVETIATEKLKTVFESQVLHHV